MRLVFIAQGGAPSRREAQISERKKLKKRLTHFCGIKVVRRGNQYPEVESTVVIFFVCFVCFCCIKHAAELPALPV